MFNTPKLLDKEEVLPYIIQEKSLMKSTWLYRMTLNLSLTSVFAIASFNRIVGQGHNAVEGRCRRNGGFPTWMY